MFLDKTVWVVLLGAHAASLTQSFDPAVLFTFRLPITSRGFENQPVANSLVDGVVAETGTGAAMTSYCVNSR